MRKPIIAGNWKMNLTASEAKDFAEAVKNNIPANDKVDSVIGSPALFLQELVEAAKGTDLKISAQNCYWENAGAKKKAIPFRTAHTSSFMKAIQLKIYVR